MLKEKIRMPGSPAEILPATWRDLKELRHLEEVCFQQDAWSLLELIGVLSFTGVQRFKAMVDHQMVGFIAGEVHRPNELAWIATFGVLPEFQRQGIGRALLQICEAHLGVSTIRLTVRVGNIPAIQLYQGVGYQQVGIWPDYYRGNVDAVVFEKNIPDTL